MIFSLLFMMLPLVLLLLLLSNESGQSMWIRQGPDEEAMRGRGWAKQNKQNKTNMMGCFKCGSQIHTEARWPTHIHSQLNTHFWLAQLEEAEERKKMTVLRTMELSGAHCWPAPIITKQKHFTSPAT